jgi:hypothetical protein
MRPLTTGGFGRHVAIALFFAVVTFVLAACAGGAPDDGSTTVSPRETSPAPASSPEPPGCPNPDGGTCLGVLQAGTYSTRTFQPKLTYTVPDGWANYEDDAGNAAFAPPGVNLSKVEQAVDDIFIMTIVAPATMNCEATADTNVPDTAKGVSSWLSHHPWLSTSQPKAVTIGGLRGYVLSVRPTSTGGIRCGGPVRSVPLVVGVGGTSQGDFWLAGPSDHALVYLLNFEGLPLGIVADSSGQYGPSLAADAKVVRQFRFAKR